MYILYLHGPCFVFTNAIFNLGTRLLIDGHEPILQRTILKRPILNFGDSIGNAPKLMV